MSQTRADIHGDKFNRALYYYQTGQLSNCSLNIIYWVGYLKQSEKIVK